MTDHRDAINPPHPDAPGALDRLEARIVEARKGYRPASILRPIPWWRRLFRWLGLEEL